MGIYAPTLGIIGAVLGLMAVMKNLADPSKLGPGIAAAFTATVYGIGAANLVLRALGGPAGLTAFWRQHGDQISRLDRWEPALNEAAPGDVRDTTTPLAAARGVWALALGDGLAGPARRTWLDWLAGNQLSGSLLRAGMPADWRVADRSGAGGHGARSIVAVVWPPRHPPLTLAVYLTGTTAELAVRDAAIAGLGRALVADMAAKPQVTR